MLDADIWKRDKKSLWSERRYKPINEKESAHWLNGYQTACEISSMVPETLIVNIADRGGDVYEWFLETEEYSPNTRSQWLIRAAQDRLLEPTAKKTKKIWKKLEKQPILGTITFTQPASGNRKAREVEQTVRASRLTLKAPRRSGYKYKNVKINAVLAREEEPPDGEEALEWWNRSSLP